MPDQGPATRNVSRRVFLLGGAAAAGGATLLGAPKWASAAAEPTLRYPFHLGVASGDPLPDSVVLWTRLAPAPLNGDGMGGMPNSDFTVTWELATDEGFTSIVKSDTVLATAADGHSVHVIPEGLQSNAWYYYRFRVQNHESPVGRTRTAPTVTETPSSFTFAMASCQHFEEGWYHAHRAMANDNPDLVLWLGDYMYEWNSDAATNVRGYTVAGREVNALGLYRQRYAQHRTDPNLRAAHAAAPWVSVFDDHEVKNNWAGNDPGQTSPEYGAPPIPAARKTAAFKAWWENMPVRIARPTAASIAAYRRFQWGTLARFHMLDTRQYRDDHAPDGNCATMRSTSRSITGAAQERWLLDGLADRSATWDFLGQQVFFAQRDSGGDAIDCNDMSTDSWDGYAASRQRITQGWIDRGVRNPVVLTGDVHRHWAANLHTDYYAGGTPVGTEFVTSSISSLGSDVAPTLGGMPHIRYIGNQRGYIRCRVSPGQLVGEFVGVASALTATPAAATPSVVASYAVVDGQPGLQPA